MFTEKDGMGIPASHLLAVLPSMGAIDKVDGDRITSILVTHNVPTTRFILDGTRMWLNALSDQDIMGPNDTAGVIRNGTKKGGKTIDRVLKKSFLKS